jgi:beta-lactamase regulating signal transducer with metallopeptidase domain
VNAGWSKYFHLMEIAMSALLNAILEGLILTGMMWAILRAIPRLNATTRYVCWWLTMTAVAILPLQALLSSPVTKPEIGESTKLLSSPITFSGDPGKIHYGKVTMEAKQLEFYPPYELPANDMESSAFHLPIHIARRPAEITAAILWISLSSLLLYQLAQGYGTLRRLKRAGYAAPAAWQQRLKMLASNAGVRRSARLLVSDKVSAPVALGFFKPVIIIPRSLPSQMSRCDFDHVLLHELAHLHRYDDWMNLLRKYLEALLPIQPVLFWIGRRLALDCEAACDDWVIAVAGGRKGYAESLARVAELAFGSDGGILASAVGSPSQLYRRVQRVLDKRHNLAPRISSTKLAVGFSAALLLSVGAFRAPQVFALDSTSTTAEAVPGADADPGPNVSSDAVMEATTTQPAETGKLSQAFNVEPGDKLAVKVDYGNVHVKTWDKNVAMVSVTQKGLNELKNPVAVKEYFEHHHININKDEHAVIINSTTDSGYSLPNSVKIDFNIVVPQKFEAEIKTGDGNAEIANVEGKVDIATGDGNILAEKINGSLKVASGDGNIAASECTDAIYAKSGNGTMSFAKIDGPIDAQDGDGVVAVEACKGGLKIRDGDGIVDIARFMGPSINAATGSGNILAGIDGPLKGESALKSGSGNIVLNVPAQAALNIVAITGSGKIGADLPGDDGNLHLANANPQTTAVGPEPVVPELPRPQANGADTQIWKLNGGGTSITLTTGSGNIDLQKH